MELFTIRSGPKLVPASSHDLERLERVRSGEPLRTTVVFGRSLAHQRWYRGLVAIVADAIGADAEALHQDLKFRAGLLERITLARTASGRVAPAILLKSTAFAAMEEADFRRYTDAAVEIIFRDYVPGANREHLFDRVAEMVGPRPQ